MRYQLAKRGKSLSTIFLIMNTGGSVAASPRPAHHAADEEEGRWLGAAAKEMNYHAGRISRQPRPRGNCFLSIGLADAASAVAEPVPHHCSG